MKQTEKVKENQTDSTPTQSLKEYTVRVNQFSYNRNVGIV